MATQPLTDGMAYAHRNARNGVDTHGLANLRESARRIVARNDNAKRIARQDAAIRRRYEVNQGLPASPSPKMIMNRLDAIIYGLPRSRTRKMGLGQDARHYRGNLTGSTSTAVKEKRAEDISETIQLFAFTQFEDAAREIFKIVLRDGSRLTDEDIQRMISLLVDLLNAIQSERS